MRGPVGIFPGAKQEHIGSVSMERPANSGLLPGLWPANRDRNQISRGICGGRGGAGSVVGGEGGGVDIFGGYHGQGGGQAPIDRLCGPAEVPPSGVGFCA